MKKTESEFDKRVAAAEDSFGTGTKADLEGVRLLLAQAGVAPTKIAELLADPSMVALIKASPDLVARMAEMYPSDYQITYYEARKQAGFGLPVEEQFASGGPDAMARNIAESGPTTSETGAVQYPGGIIVQDGQVFFPPTNSSVMGSPAWMAQIPTWSDDKKQQWATTLKQMGYIDSKQVDLKTFTDALTQYSANRYLYGGGKPVDLAQGSQGVSKADFGGLLAPAVLDTEVRQWHQELYGLNDEPSAEELKRGRARLSKIAMRISRKQGMDPTSAASVASARVGAEYRNAPAQQKWQDLEETDTGLHDSFVNLFQVLSQ